LMHPAELPKTSHVADCLSNTPGVVVAASDYLKSQPGMIARFVNKPFVTLGTDGFGRSEDRASLRNFFEVDARHIAAATLSSLLREQAIDGHTVATAFKELEIDADKIDPAIS